MKQGDKDSVNAAQSYTNNQIKAQDVKSQGYANSARSSANQFTVGKISEQDTKARGYANTAESNAKSNTSSQISAQDAKSKQYASSAKTSSVAYTNEQIKAVNDRIGSLTKGDLGLGKVKNYDIRDDVINYSSYYASSKAVYSRAPKEPDKVELVLTRIGEYPRIRYSFVNRLGYYIQNYEYIVLKKGKSVTFVPTVCLEEGSIDGGGNVKGEQFYLEENNSYQPFIMAKNEVVAMVSSGVKDAKMFVVRKIR